MSKPQTMTNEEFLEFAERPENSSRHLELIMSEVVEVEDQLPFYKLIGRKTTSAISAYLEQYPVGEVYNGRHWVTLGDGYVINPDVFFYSKERLSLSSYEQILVPDFIIEVAAEDDKAMYFDAKTHEYLRLGGRLIWVVFPGSKQVIVYTPITGTNQIQLHYATGDKIIDAGEVLPGFSVRVNDLFPVPSLEDYQVDATTTEAIVREIIATYKAGSRNTSLYFMKSEEQRTYAMLMISPSSQKGADVLLMARLKRNKVTIVVDSPDKSLETALLARGLHPSQIVLPRSDKNA